jgi:mRNA-degrading endonuclease RelE of RelBE toxin-antitoxin system
MEEQKHISGHMTPRKIADKHNVSLETIKTELKKGIPTELKEHGGDIKKATRVALDHLFENPRYYTKLKKADLTENKTSLNKDLVKEFIKHITDELKIKSLPVINMSNNSQDAIDMRSWGGYQPATKSINIVIAKRHPADIFRTLAHELVHYKQDLTGRLKPGDGQTGSDIENEANSRAAIIMRNFAQAKPSLFEHLITELGDDLNNALSFEYKGGKYNEYTFKTDKNEYKVAFKPDEDESYERVYHTTNRGLGNNFEDTQEGKPIQINATVMAITLDFIKRVPSFKTIYIVPLDKRRFNLVKRFIENNLPPQYSFESKINEGENIILIHNKPKL